MGQRTANFFLTPFVNDAVAGVFKGFSEFDLIYSSRQILNIVTTIGREKIELLLVEITPETATSRLELIRNLKSRGLKVEVIVMAPMTSEGGNMALRAVEFGAVDFVALPLLGDESVRSRVLKRRLEIVLNGYLRKRQNAIDNEILRIDSRLLREISNEVLEVKSRPRKAISFTPEILAIGISTGGPPALTKLIPQLDSVSLPVLVVQHMPPIFTASLAHNLGAGSRLNIKEAQDGDLLEKRHIYIAPGGKQMRITKDAEGRGIIRITDDAPLNNCRPSVDYLFSSLAKTFPAKVLALIMTGMGGDGAKGCLEIRESGGVVFAQDEASCVVFGMPREAVRLGGVDKILPLDELASEVYQTLANPSLAIRMLSLR